MAITLINTRIAINLNSLDLSLEQINGEALRYNNNDGAQAVKPEHIQLLHYHAGGLVYALHALRYKKLKLTPKSNKKKKRLRKIIMIIIYLYFMRMTY